MLPHLGSLRPGHQGLAAVADVEHRGRLDVIPVLLGKRVGAVAGGGTLNNLSRVRGSHSATHLHLLLASLFALRDTLIFSDRHGAGRALEHPGTRQERASSAPGLLLISGGSLGGCYSPSEASGSRFLR